MHQHAKPIKSPLYVITPVFNPKRYGSRYQLYRQFEKHVQDAGGVLYTIEAALGDREFEVTDPSNPQHLQVRTWDELWTKENQINLAMARLPADWQYVAWIDADITFARHDWVQETKHQLQHHHFVQMFSHAIDAGPNGEPLETFEGFVYCYLNGLKPSTKYGFRGHPGFAWAARREALDHVGGLIDWAALGAADHHMATALIGEVDKSIHGKIDGTYRSMARDWQALAEKHLQRDVGYVPGTIMHHFHGKKKDRKYQERWQILIDNGFDPQKDLKRDMQGMWQLTGRNFRLRDALRAYFAARNEDSIDL